MENKMQDLLSRVDTLEGRFSSYPGDVAEQRRRSEVIRCVIIFCADSVLSSSQQVQGH